MQPLMRHVSRSIFDTLRTPQASRQLSTRHSTRASTCIKCEFQSQKRHFADETKPKDPLQAPSTALPIYEDASPLSPELPSARETRRSATAKRLSSLMDNLPGNIFIASQRLNDLTGYSGIEALKDRITALEGSMASCQDAVRQARVTYKTTIADRAASQREVTGLLARKDTWTPVDLERFTALYRSDHGNEQAVQEAATRLADCERAAEQAASKLSSSILSRYHEEQIWSDKIRRMSTWGTWGLMGVNVLLFLVFQFGFEPWRRARLVRGFEEKVREALEKEKTSQANTNAKTEGDKTTVMAAHGDQDQTLLNGIVAAGIQELEEETGDDTNSPVPAVDALATVIRSGSTEVGQTALLEQAPPSATLTKPETWRPALLDLFSHRTISVSKHDVTIIALEGVATGAAFVGLIAMFALRQN